MNGGSKDESQSQLRLYGRRQNSVRQNAVRGTGRPPFGSSVGQHNIVDVGRIRQGLDVRTTVSSLQTGSRLLSHIMTDYAPQHPK